MDIMRLPSGMLHPAILGGRIITGRPETSTTPCLLNMQTALIQANSQSDFGIESADPKSSGYDTKTFGNRPASRPFSTSRQSKEANAKSAHVLVGPNSEVKQPIDSVVNRPPHNPNETNSGEPRLWQRLGLLIKHQG